MLEQMPAYSWNGSVFTINYQNSRKVIKEGSHWVSIEYFDEERKDGFINIMMMVKKIL